MQKKLDIKCVLDLNSPLHKFEWLFVLFWRNVKAEEIASILFEMGLFLFVSEGAPSSQPLGSALSMQTVKSSKSFASHFSHEQHREQKSL